jgi:hypothetical protein
MPTANDQRQTRRSQPLETAIRAPKNMVCHVVSSSHADFRAEIPPIAVTNRPSPEAQVSKFLLRNSHWVDNLCQCENFSA